MILASHIIAVSAIVAPLALKPLTIFNLAAIFFISVASHYLLDLIPHWDYKLSLWDFKEKSEKIIPRQRRVGQVVSAKMDKTIVVKVVRLFHIGLPVGF